MNYNEKKALWSFLLIYVCSSAVFIAILLFSYYTNEVKMFNNQCSITMQNAAQKIKTDILKAHMDNKTYLPSKLKNEMLNYALYTKDKKEIYSDMKSSYNNLSKVAHNEDVFSFHLATFEDKYDEKVNVKYILIETQQASTDIFNLQVLILGILVISIFFILIIGYFLSKLLLKPVREKIAHMDDFIKDSAHELNTPIAVLLTSASAFRQGRNQEKMLQYIVSSAKQVSHIYNDIHFCAFNEINEDVSQEFNLENLVQESVGFFKDIAIAKKIEITCKCEKAFIKMDKTKAQRIINNLLSNAIKYSNKNTNIEVVLKDSILRVKDEGIGINKHDQINIFKRYKRSSNIEGGFGIGLDIVRRIINEYNLKLDLISQENIGSTFIIDFKNVLVKNKENNGI